VCDQAGRPIILKLSAGQVSDHKGARMVLDELPPASHLIADRG
jgi:putative transposase